MNNDYFILAVRGSPYMTVKSLAESYGIKPATVYVHLKDIESCARYKDAWATINDAGDRMVNTLVYEDYLRHRGKLKNKNLARQLPPYDPAEVRRQRGEYKQAIHNTEAIEKEERELFEKIKSLFEAMRPVFEGGAT